MSMSNVCDFVGCVVNAAALLNFLLYLEQIVAKIIDAESDTEKLYASQAFDFQEFR